VASSAELNTGVVLLAGSALLWLLGPAMATAMLGMFRWHMSFLHWQEFGVRGVSRTVAAALLSGLQAVGVLLAALLLIGLFAGLLQTGFNFSVQKLQPRWDRLSPIAGWRRLCSMQSLLRGLFAVAKAAIVVAVSIWVLRGRADEVRAVMHGTLSDAAAVGWTLAVGLSIAIASALVLIGLADFAYQRFRLEQSLRMSRQELKEELREEEGDPHMRARVRKVQREIAQRRMMEEVPRATVVVTNPTHLAVALRYDRGRMPAPKVVAKGKGFLAKRIVETARRHAVPVIERRPLAQALYRAVQVGQEIPIALYQAVAELLAYVYRLRSAR
jgi:flagellar biosynthetic protein FlhB